MTQLPQQTDKQGDRAQQPAQRVRQQVISRQRQFAEMNASVASLRTEADRATSLLGFGKRILVPPDEIHVVVGDGYHVYSGSNERKVYGQSADRPARYWLNSHTQVIKLKTISFTVPIRGYGNRGVEALDNNKVSFRLWAHAVAKLNPEKAEVAAQRVGNDASGLINTITEVGTAELIAAAAGMTLEKIIQNRQQLAEDAFPKVNNILSELGYDLALLTITELDGEAYRKLVTQAEAGISKETSIATNREQLAELHDDQARAQREAEISAETDKKLAAERLEAEREVQTATLSQQEQLTVRQHEINLLQIDREKSAAQAQNEAELVKVEYSRKVSLAEAGREAEIARIKAEKEAELRALAQKRQAAIVLAETEAEAEKQALAQLRAIERRAELTQAEAERLQEEQLTKAQRAKEVALVEANKLAESLKVEAEAESLALNLRTAAEAKATLTKAEAESTSAEKLAQAAKIRAEAVQAEKAAPGLADAEVEEARLQVLEQQVTVKRAEGLAQAEIAKAQAEADADRMQRIKQVEIEAQKKLATLYESAPVLVDLEQLRMKFDHESNLMRIQADARLKMFEAMAPNMKINLYGSGGQMDDILGNLMKFAYGLETLKAESPIAAKLLSGNGTDDNSAPGLREHFDKLMPALGSLISETNPRILSSLKVNDVVARLTPVVSGDEDLTGALTQLKEDATLRMIGDMPVSPLLEMLGVKMPANSESETTEIEIVS